MENFAKLRLDELCDFVNGGAWNESEYTDSGIPVLKVSNFNSNSFSLENISYLAKDSLDKYKKHRLKQGDLVIATVGSHQSLVNSAAGRSIAVNSRVAGFYLNQNAVLVRTKDAGKLDQTYLSYLGDSGYFRNYIQVRGKGAANQMRIAIGDIKSFPVNLPEIGVQQKIAHILSAYDDLIENNLKRIKLLEEMAQITYEQWFVRMKFPGHETTPVDAETGLPEGWMEAEISALCHVNFDSITKRTAPESIRYIDIASVNTGDYETPRELSFSDAPSRARRRVKYGDTIFSTVRPNRKIYSLILENDPLLVASTGFATLTPRISGSYSFVYLSVANQVFVDKAVAVAGGAAYPAVNQRDFERLKVMIPEKEVILEFSEFVNGNFKLIGNIKVQNQLLKEAREILLPRLMTGMIDVDEIDLPTLNSDTEAA